MPPVVSKSTFILLISLLLIAYGYWLLAVPSDTLYEEVLARAKGGIWSVTSGGGLLMVWLAQR